MARVASKQCEICGARLAYTYARICSECREQIEANRRAYWSGNADMLARSPEDEVAEVLESVRAELR